MNLIEALQAVNKGKNVRMKNWSKERYLFKGVADIVGVHTTVGNCDFQLGLFDLSDNSWELYEEPKPILDAEEKAYLEAVLRPFKDRVEWVQKYYSFADNKEMIRIAFERQEHCFCLPRFKPGTMYKGMKLDNEYTIEELGLFDRKIY